MDKKTVPKGFKTFVNANPHTIFPIFFIEIAPIMIATVSSSRFPKKSMNASNMAFLSISFMVVAIKSKIPSTHTFIVFANAPKSNALKKLLMPSAMLYPNCLKSNVSPNDKAEYTTVFNALAIVFPTSPNRVCPLYPSNKPLRNSARPVPKFLAFSYALFQSMLSIASIKVSLIVLPSFLNVSISLSNGNTSPVFFHWPSYPEVAPEPVPPGPLVAASRLSARSDVKTFNSSNPCNCCFSFFALSAAFPVPVAKSSALSAISS